MTPTTADRVRLIIQEQLGKDEAPDVAHLVYDLGVDSLDVIALVMDLEQAFNIAIRDQDLDQIATVGDTIALVERLTAQPATA